MTFPLFALILITLLDELGNQIQFLQDEEDAMIDLAFQEAEDRWISLHDYPDHW